MVSALFFSLNTLFWSTLLYPLILVKPVFPGFFHRMSVRIGEMWISWNDRNREITQDIDIEIQMDAKLDYHESYLVVSNHQSWLDIVILQHVFNRKIPFLRFFLKSQLLYVPLLGGAWWALGYPFMKRYSKAYFEKHPERKGEDLKTARASLQKFKGRPVAILNFLEGTRFTPQKHEQQGAPYQNLLLPKAGGMALTIQTLQSQIHKILDVTLVYPDGVVSLWAAFNGKLSRVKVHVREIAIPEFFYQGRYENDAEVRSQIQSWIHQLWQEKDNQIRALKA